MYDEYDEADESLDEDLDDFTEEEKAHLREVFEAAFNQVLVAVQGAMMELHDHFDLVSVTDIHGKIRANWRWN